MSVKEAASRLGVGRPALSNLLNGNAALSPKDIDRALPRLVVAAFLTEAFGYSRLELTERELGTRLIIEAGTKKP